MKIAFIPLHFFVEASISVFYAVPVFRGEKNKKKGPFQKDKEISHM